MTDRVSRVTVGMIGVGRMAAPMAERLHASGYELHLYDLNPSACRAFAGRDNIQIAVSPEALLSTCHVVFMSLPTPKALVEVVEGLTRALVRGGEIATHSLVNTSTTGIAASRRCLDLLRRTPIDLVDAPVSGGETGAKDGTLTFIVSGPEMAKSAVAPLLEVLGSRRVDVGETAGLAQAVKAANNYLSLGALMATAEATSVLQALGVKLSDQLEVFNASSGRNSATAVKYAEQVLTGKYDFGFPVDSVIKDLLTFAEASNEVDARMPLADATIAQWKAASSAGWGKRDCTYAGSFVQQTYLNLSGVSDTVAPWPQAGELWARATYAAESASAEDFERAAGCLAIAITEMGVAARDAALRRTAQGVAGTVEVNPSGAIIAALSFLQHAKLADDSFETACHPGLAVIPTSLALAASVERPVRGVDFLKAIIAGYEVSCTVTHLLMPVVAERGWRISAVVAPIAAAATGAYLRALDVDAASSALALASTSCGGPLATTTDGHGDGWRLQPGLAAQSGVTAVQAAEAGAEGGRGAFSGQFSIWELFGPSQPSELPQPGRLIHRVTFKQYETAMYGQAIYDAILNLDQPKSNIDAITLRVPEFAVRYGGREQSGISGLEAILAGAFGVRSVVLPGDRVEIVGSSELDDLEAEVTVVLETGEILFSRGSGDTSGWRKPDFVRHCRSRLTEGAEFGNRCFDLLSAEDIRGEVRGYVDQLLGA